MITSVQIKGYKILRDIEITPARLTVLVGPNGCGKSSVLEAVEGMVRTLVEEGERMDFSVRLSNPDSREMFLSLTHSRLDEAMVLHGKLEARKKNLMLDTQKPRSPMAREVGWRRNLLWPLCRLRFAHDHLVAPTPAATGTPTLTPAGEGLATLVNHLASRRDGSLERIEEGVRKVVPAFRRLGTEAIPVKKWQPDQPSRTRQSLTTLPGHRLLVTLEGVGEIPAEQVSEGTMFVIGLLSYLHLQAARTVLLDDVDRGLHPKAQLELVELLRGVTELPEGPQIIATAHSPMLLAGLREGEIVRLDLDDARGCVVVEEQHAGPPGWMTINEILDHYFGVQRPALGADLQRYALLAGDPRRSDAEDVEMAELRTKLLASDLDPGIEPARRG
ncbi:MAG: AAA family ATPase [Pseudomonadota bacterium]